MFSLERMLKIWAKYNSFYWDGLGKTLIFALLAVLLGLVLGLGLACGRMQRASRRQNPVVRGLKGLCRFLCTTYVEVFRATPMLVQIFIIYYGIGSLIKLPETSVNRMFWGMVAVGLNSAAYMSEIIRAGIGAVPPGQMEAARSLGMTHWQAMRRVVFPQAIKNSLPAIGNEFIINIKDSSVLCVLGVSDLMFMTRSVAGIYYKGTECYLIAATVYLFLTYLSSLLLKAITGRMTAPDNTKRRQGNQTVDLGLPSSN